MTDLDQSRLLLPPGVPHFFQLPDQVVCHRCSRPLALEYRPSCGLSHRECTHCTPTNIAEQPPTIFHLEKPPFDLWRSAERARLRLLHGTHRALVANIEQQLVVAQARRLQLQLQQQQDCGLVMPKTLRELAALTSFVEWQAREFETALAELGWHEDYMRVFESQVAFSG